MRYDVHMCVPHRYRCVHVCTDKSVTVTVTVTVTDVSLFTVVTLSNYLIYLSMLLAPPPPHPPMKMIWIVVQQQIVVRGQQSLHDHLR